MAKKRKPKLGPGRLTAAELANLPDRLLDAAVLLFNARGYASTTMEHIAKQAGASTKTVYSRYPNKAAIAKAVAQRIVEATLAGHFAAIRVDDPREVEPRSLLVSLGRQIAGAISGGETSSLVYLAMSEARRFPELAGLYKASMERGVQYIRTALEAWRSDGLLDELLDVDRGARLCLSMISDSARIRAALGDPMTPAEIEAHVTFAVGIFLRGCGHRS